MKKVFACIAYFAIACVVAPPAGAYGNSHVSPSLHVMIPSANGESPGTKGLRWGLMCDSPAALEDIYNRWMDTKNIGIQDYVLASSHTITAGACWWAGPTPVAYIDLEKIFRPEKGSVFRIDLYIRLDTGEEVYQFDVLKRQTSKIRLYFRQK